MTLGQTLSPPVQQQRDVRIGGRLEAPQTQQGQLARRGHQDVAPPHHLGDAHQGIVQRHGQLVGHHAVGTAQGKIAAAVLQREGLPAQQAVLKMETSLGTAQAQAGTPPLGLAPVPLFRAQMTAGAGIGGPGIVHMGRSGQLAQLLAGAVAGIDQPGTVQGIQRGIIQGRAGTLEIGAARALLRHVAAVGRDDAVHGRALVPVQPQPAQVLHQGTGICGARTLRVDVLHAQDQRPAGAAYRQPGQEEGPGIAQMHVSRGTGGQPSPQGTGSRR